MSEPDLSKEPIPNGMGEAAFMLMIGLLARLKAKGVLDQEDLRLIIDSPMLGLEQQKGLDQKTLLGVHGLLDVLAQMFLGSAGPTGSR